MIKKIKEVSESIKSKISFEDYTPTPNNVETLKPNEVNTSILNEVSTETPKELKTSKVQRTFYIRKDIADKFDDFYAKCLMERKKFNKSDIISQAILNLVENENAIIGVF